MIDLKDKNIKFFVKTFSNSIRWDTHKYFEDDNIQSSPDIKFALFKNCIMSNKNFALEIFDNFSDREIKILLKDFGIYEEVKRFIVKKISKAIKEKENL